MNPYEVLGIDPQATPDEIEAAYHRRLRACHPDLHWADGPEAVTRAEEQTRAVTAAMAQLRRQWDQGPRFSSPPGSSRGGPGPGSASGAWTDGTSADDAWDRGTRDQHESWSNFGYTPDADHDWFGNPVDRRVRADHVDCPLCGERYDDPNAYRYHLASVHEVGDPERSFIPETGVSFLAGKGAWLGWVPWPAFWFGIALIFYWTVAIALLPTLLLRATAIWLGVFGYLVLLRLAFKHRRAR